MRRAGAIVSLLTLLFMLMATTGAVGIAAEEMSFEDWLTEQEFPAGYWPALQALHEEYPQWVFRAQHTGLSWQEVLDAESAVGVSLIYTKSLDSWKSCEKGAYDPASGTWYGLDGSSWVAASREMVAYCLDPRNFLDAVSIFQFENLAYSDTHTLEGVQAILSGTFMADLAETFMLAGQESGVSPYHLASRARQEQGASGNGLGRGEVAGYEGYYNLFNINAYATSTLSALQNGARYAASTNESYLLPWTSQELAVKGGAIILGRSYINREQNTLYLQKFDVTDGGNGFFRHQYMTNIQAPASESKTLAAAYSDEVKAGAMEFCIPVYEDMPETPCAQPTSSGSNDNLLSELTVEGQTLTPTFSMYTDSYELMVESHVSSIHIRAVTNHSAASVEGAGDVTLTAGVNTVPVRVTAPSGVVRTYTLSVYRAPTEGSDAGEIPALTCTAYRLSDRVRGVAPQTAKETFLDAFSVENASLSLVTAAGLPVSGQVGTGHLLQLIRGENLLASYPVVIRGDVSGDGNINALDLLKIQKHILGVTPLTGAATEAADANADGDVNARDLLRTQRHILGLTVIEQ